MKALTVIWFVLLIMMYRPIAQGAEDTNVWPARYLDFQAAGEAAGVLVTAVNRRAVQKTLLSLWTNVFEKSLPTDEQQAFACLVSKRDIVYIYFNAEKFQENKSHWMDVAKLVAEIRSRIIPNYQNQAVVISISSPDVGEVKRMIEKEEKRGLSTGDSRSFDQSTSI